MIDARRNVPRAILLGVGVVIVAYLTANRAYLDERGLGPKWYPISLAFLAIPQCWAGGSCSRRSRAGLEVGAVNCAAGCCTVRTDTGCVRNPARRAALTARVSAAYRMARLSTHEKGGRDGAPRPVRRPALSPAHLELGARLR